MFEIGLELVECSRADGAGKAVLEQEDGPLDRFVKRLSEVLNALKLIQLLSQVRFVLPVRPSVIVATQPKPAQVKRYPNCSF